MSTLIAPLKKAQRKSEGGQLFPESVFPLRATPFPKTPQKPPTPLIFKGVSVILLFHFILSVRNISVFASMPSEQTCLQGFANDGIHKALAFLIKNAGNDSFNAPALSAE